MDDKEFFRSLWICTPIVISFVLFPAFCLVTILFGYVRPVFIIIECVVGALITVCFALRTWFLNKYPKYAGKKRFYFETVSYLFCLVFAIGTGFAVTEDSGVFSYYFLNIYIQPAYMIYVFVVMGFHIATGKKVAKAYDAEKRARKKFENDTADKEDLM